MIDERRRDLLKLAAVSATLPWVDGMAGSWAREASVLRDPDVPGLMRAFTDPPLQARPAIYWYWMNGNITRAGISADLEAMHTAGIRTVLLFSIGGEGPATIVAPAAQSLTPYWWELIAFAVAEAGRLGLEITMNACDGWATASGPWITPELSMQHVVWSEISIKGGQRFRGGVPRPAALHDYYRDLRVVAYSHPLEWNKTSITRAVTVSSSFPMADSSRLADPANTQTVIDADTAGEIVFSFDQAFTLRSVTVRTPPLPGSFPGVQRAANSLLVEASDDGTSYRPVGHLDYPRHGWETDLTTLTHALPPTRARFFRFRHVPEPAPAYREDLHHAGNGRLRLLSLLLSSRPQIHALPAKSADAWAMARRMTDEDIPDRDCVPVDRLIDLTARLYPDGTLDWPVPDGYWTILRIGYTTTGKSNSIAGGGKGLECDKMSRAAARVQFDGWYGKALEKVGPQLAGKVLHVLHVDSWEAGSQNWTPGFAEEFRARRGYDLLPILAIMAGVPVASADFSERVLFDVRRTVAELVSDLFFAEMAVLARKNGCIFSGEVVNPTMVADGLDYGRSVDIPMGEFWLRTPENEKPSDIREAVSAAHIYGRSIAGSEAFTEFELKWDETPWMLKARGDHHYAQGINRFYLHVYAHQPWLDRAPGMTLSGIGTFFSRTQTWWQQGHAYLEYIARSQALLQSGQPVVDIAVFIGEDMPARALLPEALPVQIPSGYHYDSINRDALMRLARIENRMLVLSGGMRYRLLILPDRESMTPELAARLAGFAKQGLTILGRLASTSPGALDAAAMDRKVAALNRQLKLVPYAELSSALNRMSLQPDVIVNGDSEHSVEWTHRAGASWNLYYFSNQSDASITIEVDVRATGVPSVWRPDNGKVEPVMAWTAKSGQTRLRLQLEARDAQFVVLDGRAIRFANKDPVIAMDGDPSARLVATQTGAALHTQGPGRWALRRQSGMTAVLALKEKPPVIDIVDWRLSLPGIDERAWPILSRWDESSEEAIRHFSGTATYRTLFRVPISAPGSVSFRWLLDLGMLAEIAEVRLNRRNLGVLWKPLFHVDVTEALQSGENTLEVAVTNTWLNRLIGDAGQPQRKSFVTPELRFGQPWQPQAGDRLLPAGMTGPVRLRAVAELPISWQARKQ